MNRQQTNQSYYQKNKQKLQEQRRLKYQTQKSQFSSAKKKDLGEYYHANNIKVLVSLKDYLDSSSERMKLWYRFSSILNDIKEGVSDIIELMRLREVMDDLIKDYWQIAKKQIKITKKWNKLSERQKLAKQKQWAAELRKEEQELFAQFEQQQANQMRKEKAKKFSYQSGSRQGKQQCPECDKWVKELDSENNLCQNCLVQYEQ